MGFLSNLIDGISLGSIYAVIALGYTMVYGIAKMLNFAHGDVIMIGAYVVYITFMKAGLPPLVALLISMVACTLLGVTIEKIAYKPLRKATSLAVLITAIGVSYFLQNIALVIFGANPITFKSIIDIPEIRLFGGEVVIASETSVAVIVSVVIVIG